MALSLAPIVADGIARLEPGWSALLADEFAQAYFIDLSWRIEQAYAQDLCLPEPERIFTAFNLCPLDRVRCVLIGQDPYHNPGQAHGLCFSVREGVTTPPSLLNIFKELHRDLSIPPPTHGDLTRWAQQGVLLLNAVLTVRPHQPGSHAKLGWQRLTSAVIAALSRHKRGLVFLLWGNFAKKKGKCVDRTRHLVLESGHPSPLSANQGLWFGSGHFSKTNQYLIETARQPIQW